MKQNLVFHNRAGHITTFFMSSKSFSRILKILICLTFLMISSSLKAQTSYHYSDENGTIRITKITRKGNNMHVQLVLNNFTSNITTLNITAKNKYIYLTKILKGKEVNVNFILEDVDHDPLLFAIKRGKEKDVKLFEVSFSNVYSEKVIIKPMATE